MENINNMNTNMEEQFKIAQQLSMIESIAKQKMSKEAITRYGNLKTVHSQIATAAIVGIAQAVQAGQIKDVISDEQFKSLLQEMQKGKKNFKLIK